MQFCCCIYVAVMRCNGSKHASVGLSSYTLLSPQLSFSWLHSMHDRSFIKSFIVKYRKVGFYRGHNHPRK